MCTAHCAQHIVHDFVLHPRFFQQLCCVFYVCMCVEFCLSGSGAAGQESSTRVMIFSSFRESVQEIATLLNRHQPLVNVMTFMGQASAGKGVRGFTQKEQLEVNINYVLFYNSLK